MPRELLKHLLDPSYSFRILAAITSGIIPRREPHYQTVWPRNCYALRPRGEIGRHISNFRKSLLPEIRRRLVGEIIGLSRGLTAVS